MAWRKIEEEKTDQTKPETASRAEMVMVRSDCEAFPNM